MIGFLWCKQPEGANRRLVAVRWRHEVSEQCAGAARNWGTQRRKEEAEENISIPKHNPNYTGYSRVKLWRLKYTFCIGRIYDMLAGWGSARQLASPGNAHEVWRSSLRSAERLTFFTGGFSLRLSSATTPLNTKGNHGVLDNFEIRCVSTTWCDCEKKTKVVCIADWTIEENWGSWRDWTLLA